jgi:effector-binding domain-containing protein
MIAIDEPAIVETGELIYACLPLIVLREEIGTVMAPGIAEVRGAIAAQGVASAGPWFTHHLAITKETFDLEICIPVSTPIAAAGRVRPGALKAGRVARTVYHGGYEGLHGAWKAFNEWVAGRSLKPASDLVERYLVGPESSPRPADWRTELNRPLLE